MTCPYSSPITKKLLLQFILDHADYRKRSLYLQEIISMSKANDVWRHALLTFLDASLKNNWSLKPFSKN
jgi:hypothetical protein